jgi:hypothetical protein
MFAGKGASTGAFFLPHKKSGVMKYSYKLTSLFTGDKQNGINRQQIV